MMLWSCKRAIYVLENLGYYEIIHAITAVSPTCQISPASNRKTVRFNFKTAINMVISYMFFLMSFSVICCTFIFLTRRCFCQKMNILTCIFVKLYPVCLKQRPNWSQNRLLSWWCPLFPAAVIVVFSPFWCWPGPRVYWHMSGKRITDSYGSNFFSFKKCQEM